MALGFKVFLLVGILVGVFAMAEIYDQQNTPELTVNCKDGDAFSPNNAKLQFPAASDMATDPTTREYYHNDPNSGAYLDIPYSFSVPGLDDSSHLQSAYSGGGWRKGWLHIVINRYPILDANLALIGWSYAFQTITCSDWRDCSHADEDGYSWTTYNFW